MSLNSKYFTTLKTINHGNCKYRVIKPKGRPMVLFSKVDGTPLASLHLRCQNNSYQNNDKGNRGKALFAQRHAGAQSDFQGMVTKDNQEIELVISNLTDMGMINFNILKKPRKVVEVDPGVNGFGLNQVNELHKLQSYSIKCDQKDNCVLVLSTIKKKDKKEEQGKITLKEDEGSVDGPKGAYYYLSVVPEGTKDKLIDLYKDTVWKCVDLFVIKIKSNESMRFRPEMINESFDFECAYSPPSMSYNNTIPESISYYNNTIPESISYYNNSIHKSLGSTRGIMTDNDTVMLDGGMDDMVTKGISSKSLDSTQVQQDVIDDSFASSVTSGRKIEVNVGYTGVKYYADVPSNDPKKMCKIGLSVSENIIMGTKPKDEDLVEIGKKMVEDIIKNEGKQLLQQLTKVYQTTDHCVVCLEGVKEKKPIDTVYFQCGHKCCHRLCGKDLTKCPMCRAHISAQIMV